MGLFVRKKREIDLNLVGRWDSDISDNTTLNSIGDVTIFFDEKGNFVYQINELDKKQIIKMIYWVESNILFSDQPSHPEVNKTKFLIENSNTLLLEYEGVETKFLKHSY